MLFKQKIYERYYEFSIFWAIQAFKRVCLLGKKYFKKNKKLGFLLAIPLGLKIFTTQPNIPAFVIALKLFIFIISLFLKF